MSRVSIIMPTYNRADTVLRALASVRAQTFPDWELHIIDDGSTDGSRRMLAAERDPRIKVHLEDHRGVADARNKGLAESTGDYVAFLDSDDEWFPHHLELCVAFFKEFPKEHVVSGEFWVDFATGTFEKHFRVSMGEWFVGMARQVDSTSLDLPPGESDDYLRFYETRMDVGPWARKILDPTPYREVFHYRGNILSKWRWGYLMALQSTLITREAMRAVGPFDPRYATASDFGYLAKLCRPYPANMLSVPIALKHEYGPKGSALAEDHLATGKTAGLFAKHLLSQFEELFWKGQPPDLELARVRGLHQLYVARMELQSGQRQEALFYLEQAAKVLPGLEPTALKWLAKLSLHPEASRQAYRLLERAKRISGRARGGVHSILRKALSLVGG
jgi:glycosyltransferase involved in cell wall biosynthesis